MVHLLAGTVRGALAPWRLQPDLLQERASALRAGQAGGKSRMKWSPLLHVRKSPRPHLYPGKRQQSQGAFTEHFPCLPPALLLHHSLPSMPGQ